MVPVKGVMVQQKITDECSNFHIWVGEDGHMFQFRVIFNIRMSDTEMRRIVNEWLDTMKLNVSSKTSSSRSDLGLSYEQMNEKAEKAILEVLKNGDELLITEINSATPYLRTLSNKKLSAICVRLTEKGMLIKTIKRKKSYFSLSNEACSKLGIKVMGFDEFKQSSLKELEGIVRDQQSAYQRGIAKIDKEYARRNSQESSLRAMEKLQSDFGDKYTSFAEKLIVKANKVIGNTPAIDELKFVVDILDEIFGHFDALTLAPEYYYAIEIRDKVYYVNNYLKDERKIWNDRYLAHPGYRLQQIEDKISVSQNELISAQEKLKICEEKHQAIGELETKLIEINSRYAVLLEPAIEKTNQTKERYDQCKAQKDQVNTEFESLGFFAFGKKKAAKVKLQELQSEASLLIEAWQTAQNEQEQIEQSKMPKSKLLRNRLLISAVNIHKHSILSTRCRNS